MMFKMSKLRMMWNSEDGAIQPDFLNRLVPITGTLEILRVLQECGTFSHVLNHLAIYEKQKPTS